MKLLVIQEQHFTQKSNGEIWVDKQSDCSFWNRYLEVFDEIVVCARMKYSDKMQVKALRSDRENVSFVGLPDFRGAAGIVKNYPAIRHSLERALSQVDCVIFRAPSPISLVTYGLVKKSGKPFAIELMNNPHTHFSPKAMHHWYQPVIQWFITNQTKRMCRRANGVAYVTERVLQKMYPSAVQIAGHESIAHFEAHYSTINLAENDYICDIWPDTVPKPLYLVHSGEMIDDRKGQDIFIKCVFELRNRGYDARGILIGDGENRSKFELLGKELGIDNFLSFVGWQSGFKKVQEQLHKGHFFVFPSIGEGLPRSVIEAMATGLLCFGSNVDGIPELLEKSCLVDDWSAQAFADRIEKYIISWNDAIKMREVQFLKSKEYENHILQQSRNIFYKKLRMVAEKVKR